MNKYVVKDNDSIVIETTPGLRQGFSIHGACDKLNELTAKVEALEKRMTEMYEELNCMDGLEAENKRLLALIKSIPCSCFEGAHTKRCFKSKARMERPTND